MQLVLRLPAKRIALVLALMALATAALSLAGRYFGGGLGDEDPWGLRLLARLFDVNDERSLATWYASILLLACALALAVTALFERLTGAPARFYWLGLALGFMSMSAEEVAGLHEQFNGPLERLLGTSGWFYFGWVVVGIGVVVVFAGLYFRFWRRLDPRTRWLFALAALVYLTGSIGFEMIGGNLLYSRGGPTLRYLVVSTLEELLEMLGVVLFFYAQIGYLARYLPAFSVRVVDQAETDLILFSPRSRDVD